jgi:two-component system, OmpR family, sensor histidine kinase MtrB
VLRRRGIRARLALTLVALVALTAILLGAGAYVFVETNLHDQVLRDAAAQARFDLSATIPDRGLPADPTCDDVVDSGLRQTFLQRGVDSIIDAGDCEPVVSKPDLVNALAGLPDGFTSRVDAGELAYAWTTVAGRPSLTIGGRLAGAGPAFYFIHDVSAIDEALGQFRAALTVGTIALILVALLVAQAVARGVLAPVEAAGRAAEAIEHGDLSARVPVTSDDEFGTWAERFNRMAAALAETIGRLEAAEAQNRRFVADVAHELRTPLAALVAEASILREHLDALPEASRRAGELLVSDVGRLRSLVDDLMEVSRFDAHAEQIAVEPVDLSRSVRTVTAYRLPEATLALPDGPLVIETDPRRFDRIVANLLDNAREHAPAAPVAVSLTTDSAEGEIVVAVTDRGPGVPPDRLARIFDRFYKADPSRHGGSSGLGLAIAAEHAALLGGYLTASNLAEGGLRMELRLPVTGSLPPGDAMAIDGADARMAPIRYQGA